MENSIKVLIESKPSKALEAMFAGLKNPRNLRINTQYFVFQDEVACYGCAATVGIQHLVNKDYVQELETYRQGNGPQYGHILWHQILSYQHNYDKQEVVEFEKACECARKGNLLKLFVFCGLGQEEHSQFVDANQGKLPALYITTNNYREEMLKLQTTVSLLKEAGH